MHILVHLNRINTCSYIFFLRMCRLFLTLDTIDFLCLVYSNLRANKIIFKINKRSFMEFNVFHAEIWNKLIIKYRTYPKSGKIDAFGQGYSFVATVEIMKGHEKTMIFFVLSDKKYLTSPLQSPLPLLLIYSSQKPALKDWYLRLVTHLKD